MTGMWWCSKCAIWCGSKLDSCSAGHERPVGATVEDDVEEPGRYQFRHDQLGERARRRVRSLRRRFGRD